MNEKTKEYMKDPETKNKQASKNEILLIKMFSGGFNKNNLGHEIINYFLPDAGEEYHIFVPPLGQADGKHNIEYILLLEQSNVSYVSKVVAVIKNPEIDNSNPDSICYNGVRLSKIPFCSSNSRDDNLNDEIARFSNFKCSKENYFSIRDKGIYLLPAHDEGKSKFNETKWKEISKMFTDDSLIKLKKEKKDRGRRYVSDKDDCEEIKSKVEALCSGESEHIRASDYLKNVKSENRYESDNPFNWTNNEYDENSITSLLGTVLKYDKHLTERFVSFLTNDLSRRASRFRRLWERFVSFLANDPSPKSCQHPIVETQRLALTEAQKTANRSDGTKFTKGIIDLYLETDSYGIVIENKIKSDINGKRLDQDGTERTQLNVYDDYLVNHCKNKGKKLILLVPNYHCDYSIDKNCFHSDFRLVKYSEIRDFFTKYSKEKHKINESFKLLLNILKKHSYTLNEEMLYRFQEATKN